ncbi:hypothetical protein J2T02_003387 [Chitinophaga terrae (ex Kim and Jung 2007)]|jgi:hypothetical protein|nr:hypothetical protein [Chitinophaga terrae (ex Kim and Jung 2007)]
MIQKDFLKINLPVNKIDRKRDQGTIKKISKNG